MTHLRTRYSKQWTLLRKQLIHLYHASLKIFFEKLDEGTSFCANDIENYATFPGISKASLITKTNDQLTRGDRVSVCWPYDGKYYPGTLQHLHRDGFVIILYDVDEREKLNMKNEIWQSEQSLTGNAESTENDRKFGKTSDALIDTEPAEHGNI